MVPRKIPRHRVNSGIIAAHRERVNGGGTLTVEFESGMAGPGDSFQIRLKTELRPGLP